jgi:hypothetical protein
MNAFARAAKLQKPRLRHMVGPCCIQAYVQTSLMLTVQ